MEFAQSSAVIVLIIFGVLIGLTGAAEILDARSSIALPRYFTGKPVLEIQSNLNLNLYLNLNLNLNSQTAVENFSQTVENFFAAS